MTLVVDKLRGNLLRRTFKLLPRVWKPRGENPRVLNPPPYYPP